MRLCRNKGVKINSFGQDDFFISHKSIIILLIQRSSAIVFFEVYRLFLVKAH